jgi:hypothetical protein
MKMTLLEIVQDILSDMDSDEVNSISDTAESEQVAQIVKSTFYAQMNTRNWPHTRKLIALEASGNIALPTHTKLADAVKELISVSYNCAKLGDTKRSYKNIKYLDPDDFLRMTNRRNSDEANIDIIVDPTGIELLIRNDQAPTYLTSFDDVTIVFDSYDAAVDDTIQNSKVQAMGYVIPTWETSDDFIPDMPDEGFTVLLEEAKSRASFKLKQTADQKAEQEAGRQNRWLSRKAWRVAGGVKYPDYGRRGANRYRDPTFRDYNR